ncbi:MAG: alkaline phosphatase family protein [Myxococcales bacterium]|nr:alkaline phosphatase family protein [Myxococcales bacterium]
MRRVPATLATVATVAVWAACSVATSARADAPGLVLLVAVDQLRTDRVNAELPGGLGRLVREGRFFRDAVLEHALTQTCPGHVTMLTGRHPGPAGVPGNSFVDPETAQVVYCVQDDAPDARTLGGTLGRSPRLIRVDALGDWMKRARPAARVFSVAQKDRSAIALGGRRPDAAYWLDQAALGFTTSRYYLPELPGWVRELNREGEGLFDGVPEFWTYPVPAGAPRPDDYPAESDRFRRASPHPIRGETLAESLESLYFTPYSDLATLRFARTLVEQEQLGEGDGTDLLAISLAATDTVGHFYGPESWEAHDALQRLDEGLGEFLAFLEQRVGPGRLLVVLTADHGVLPLPEWLSETGGSRCPKDGGRESLRWLGFGLVARLHFEFGPWLSWPAPWLVFSSAGLSVNRPLAAERGVSTDEILGLAKAYLESRESVARVWTPDEIAKGSGPSEFARLYANSFDPERSADLAVQLEATCLLSPFDFGTSHGSPYLYDRAVPVIFWGAGVEPGLIRGPAATVDIAPTLAREIGIEVPGGLAGEPLPLRARGE